VIFLYSGEDDIINGKSTSEVYVQFLKLAKLITKDLPETRICFMAVKPSPGRETFQNKFEEYNNRVKSYIDKQANCNWYYLDTFSPLLTADGSANINLFADDKINLNSKGYDVWEKLIRSYLEM
jgi:lysophospholipase L1-like esterase